MQKLEQKWETFLRTIEIRQRGNLLFATSDEEPTLFVSAYSEAALETMLRHRLHEIFHERVGGNRVVTESTPDRKHVDAFIIVQPTAA